VQIELLEALGLPYEIISKNDDHFSTQISNVIEIAKNENRPVVLLIKKGTFEKYKTEIVQTDDRLMNREEALEIILVNLDENTIIVSTTGKTSREVFEIREKRGQSHQQDFLTVGSMGHCSSIAIGIALAKPHREVVCIDGDGALLMHLGSLTTIASMKPKNFRHILINNEVHESVGGQGTAAKKVDLSAIVNAVGASKIFKVETSTELKSNIRDFISCVGPSFLEVKIRPGSREDLGRPTIKPVDNKVNFMKFLEK
jgi:phosphonopyruvate decarboxylase